MSNIFGPLNIKYFELAKLMSPYYYYLNFTYIKYSEPNKFLQASLKITVNDRNLINGS